MTICMELKVQPYGKIINITNILSIELAEVMLELNLLLAQTDSSFEYILLPFTNGVSKTPDIRHICLEYPLTEKE